MIARKELGSKLVKKLDELIAKMPEKAANYPNPYEIAIWPDDIKLRDEMTLFNGWHIYEQPIYDGIDPKKVTLIVDRNFNVANTVVECLKTLKYSGPYPHHFDGVFEKSFMMRFFIHMVGDLHQPLHTASRCTPAHPGCDFVGRKFILKGDPEDLHSLWDYAMGPLKPEGGRVILCYL